LAVAQGPEKVPHEQWPVLVKLYFSHFESVFDVLITPKNIEKSSSYIIWFLQSPRASIARGDHPFIEQLRDLLEKTPATVEIDNALIRLKVNFVQDHAVYHVDSKGRIIRHDGKLFRLEQNEMDDIEKQIVSFAGVVDMRAVKRLQSEETRK
jgi:hypothetical protein